MMKLLKHAALLAAALPLAMVSAQQTPDLSSYPMANKVWLGSYGGDVEVNPETELICKRFGNLNWLVADAAVVEEGDVIAYCAYDKIVHSKSQLELAQVELDTGLKSAQWQHLEETVGLEKKAASMESEIARFKFSKAEKKLAGPELSARVDNYRQGLERQLEAIRQQLEPSQRAAELRIAKQKLIHDLERKKIDHRDLLDGSSIYASHFGVVHQDHEGEARQGIVIGSLERRGRAMVMLKVIDPEILSVKPELLQISVNDTKGRRFAGSFSHVERLLGPASGPQIYHFELRPSEDADLDAGMTGERVVGVYRTLDKAAHMVPKTKFLFKHTEEVQRLGWRGFIKSMWPKAEIIYIGPKTIAVVEGS